MAFAGYRGALRGKSCRGHKNWQDYLPVVRSLRSAIEQARRDVAKARMFL
jgi:hypothetical protein